MSIFTQAPIAKLHKEPAVDPWLKIRNLSYFQESWSTVQLENIYPYQSTKDSPPVYYRVDVLLGKEEFRNGDFRTIPIVIVTPCLFRPQIPDALYSAYLNNSRLNNLWTSEDESELAPVPYVGGRLQKSWHPTDQLPETMVLERYNTMLDNRTVQNPKGQLNLDFTWLWKERLGTLPTFPFPARTELRDTFQKSKGRIQLRNIGTYSEAQQLFWTLYYYENASETSKRILDFLKFNGVEQTYYASRKHVLAKTHGLMRQGVQPMAFPLVSLSMTMKKNRSSMKYGNITIDGRYCLQMAQKSELLNGLWLDIEALLRTTYRKGRHHNDKK